MLQVRALALAAALLWGGGFFLVGVVNLAAPGYGIAYLDLGASLYPGYAGPGGLGSVLVVTLYGLLDGAIAGAIFAWIYNLVARPRARGAPPVT